MKKFFISLFILGIFALFVFSIGWTQIRVKPGKVGIVVSKTNGVNSTPVVPGKFTWNKEFLLPTNAELLIFEIKPITVTRTVSGQLPSGDLYTSIFNSKNNFQYRFSYSFSLTMNEDELVSLLKQNKISNTEDLNAYLNNAADTIAQLSTDYILKRAQENENFRPESVRRDDLSRNIQSYKECPDVELSVFAITESILPDFKLYKQLQSNVEEKIKIVPYSQNNYEINNNDINSEIENNFEDL